MTPLTQFLMARIAEDEHEARIAISAVALLDQGAGVDGLPETSALVAQYGAQVREANPLPWSPARIIAECQAKRRIVELHHPHDHGGEHGTATFCEQCQWDHGDDGPRIDNQPVENFGANPCSTLVALAQVYAGHPDYDTTWNA